MTATGLSISDVRASYGPTEVLHGVSLHADPGSILAMVGPSGSGKTTLLRCVAGFNRPTSGTVTIDGVPVSGPCWVAPHRRSIGYLSQDGALFPHLTVGANVAFGLPRAQRTRRRIADLLATVSLPEEYARRRPDQLSGGQQQRVSLARALARRPAVMLLDEPFSALDSHLRESTRRLVGDALRAAGMVTVLVTHDQEEALSCADLVAVLEDGSLRQLGSPQNLYERPVDVGTARLLGSTLEVDAVVSAGMARTMIGSTPALGVPDGPATVIARPHQITVRLAHKGAWTVRDIAFHGDHRRLTLTPVDHREPAYRIATDQPMRVDDRLDVQLIGCALVVPRPVTPSAHQA